MADVDRNLIAVPGLGDLQIFSRDMFGNPFPDFPCIPPNTGYSEEIAHIDRGENMHGSLFQDFYFCTDSASDAGHFVLWVGDDGSQFDDDQARIYPGAFTDMSPFYNEDGVVNSSLAAAAMLYRFFREQIHTEYTQYEPDAICKGGKMHDYNETKLSDEQVAEILQSALDDEPFEFIDVKGGAATSQARRQKRSPHGDALSPELAELQREISLVHQRARQKVSLSKQKPSKVKPSKKSKAKSSKKRSPLAGPLSPEHIKVLKALNRARQRGFQKALLSKQKPSKAKPSKKSKAKP